MTVHPLNHPTQNSHCFSYGGLITPSVLPLPFPFPLAVGHKNHPWSSLGGHTQELQRLPDTQTSLTANYNVMVNEVGEGGLNRAHWPEHRSLRRWNRRLSIWLPGHSPHSLFVNHPGTDSNPQQGWQWGVMQGNTHLSHIAIRSDMKLKWL